MLREVVSTRDMRSIRSPKVFGFDFLGFGNRRRWALQVLDRALTDLEVNRAYIDDGMRYAIYKWALIEEERVAPADFATLDHILHEAAALISYCVLGPGETEEMWGPDVRASRQARFNAVLANPDGDTFDARLIKLVLAKGVAAPDIRTQVTLETSD
jgi:hypothetical protein